MLIFADFWDNIVIKCIITGSNILQMVIFIISQQTFWVKMVWLVKNCQKCRKNSKNRKKCQKYAYFCLFLAEKSNET